MKGAVVQVKLPPSLLQDDEIFGYCCIKDIFVINEQNIFLMGLLSVHCCDHIRALRLCIRHVSLQYCFIHMEYCM